MNSAAEMKWFLLLVLAAALVGVAPVQAQAAPATPTLVSPATTPQSPTSAPTSASPLRVVTKPLAPFVFMAGDQVRGFSIDLWNEIADLNGWPTTWLQVATVTDQLAAVQDGRADVAIAGISMTPEREQVVDFSHPYFNSGLRILTRAEVAAPLASAFAVLTSGHLLQILAIGAAIWLVMAHVIWLFERSTNPAFPQGYFSGVWGGLWLATGVLATGEYRGDEVSSKLRRVFAMIWMILGLLLFAQFTASVTSLLTVERLTGGIDGPNDLAGRRVATVSGSVAAQYLTSRYIEFTGVEQVQQAYDLLLNDQVDAVVYDAPVLLYYANSAGNGKVEVVGPLFQEDTYGIALPTDSPYREPINEALLRLRQDGTYQTLHDKWFGAEQ